MWRPALGRSRPRVAFLENWGNWRGAFATTVSHDSHNLTVFGRDSGEMAVAANAVHAACRGGFAWSPKIILSRKLYFPWPGS